VIAVKQVGEKLKPDLEIFRSKKTKKTL